MAGELQVDRQARPRQGLCEYISFVSSCHNCTRCTLSLFKFTACRTKREAGDPTGWEEPYCQRELEVVQPRGKHDVG